MHAAASLQSTHAALWMLEYLGLEASGRDATVYPNDGFPGMRRIPASHPNRSMLHFWNASYSIEVQHKNCDSVSETCHVPAAAGP